MKRREHEQKINRIRSFLDSRKLDGIILSRRDSFSWITCGGDDSVFKYTEQGVSDILVTKENKYIFLSEVEKYRISDEEIFDLGFEVICYDWYKNRGHQIKKHTANRKIASDTSEFGYANVNNSFRTIRYSLMPEEIARYKYVCLETAKSVNEVCHELCIGDSEFEIAGNLTGKLLKKGISAPVCLIAVDERIKKYRHPMPGEKRVEKYALVVVGAEKYGLFSSLSRMVSFGKPSDEIIKKHAACMNIDTRMILKTQVGVKLAEVLKTGIAAYVANGYSDEWESHHQGGSTGYQARDCIATPDTRGIVLPNQAFSWNPSIAGTKCEDTFIITENGPEILTAIANWPNKEIFVDDNVLMRPDILVK